MRIGDAHQCNDLREQCILCTAESAVTFSLFSYKYVKLQCIVLSKNMRIVDAHQCINSRKQWILSQ